MFINYGTVAFELGLFSVEGKKLLEVSGFKNTNTSTTQLRQIIAKHSFKDGLDFLYLYQKAHFMRSKGVTHQKAGQVPKIYHFTLNAANHILLAAMTDKGKAARQDAIDNKSTPIIPTPPPAIPILSPELSNDPVMAIRVDKIIQEKRISAIENHVQ